MNWNAAIRNFKNYQKLERGLAENSILAYERDLKKLKVWAEEKDIAPLKISFEDLLNFIHEICSEDMAARSQSRLISAIKTFYKFLVYEDLLRENPSKLLETPKLGRKLPDVLNEGEIENLINVIDLSLEGGERNRAIIETLYGCGLRVSELTHLRISDLFFEQELIRVIGKGNKERIVPINKMAIKRINIYRNEVRNFITIKKGNEDYLFLNRRGSKLSREFIFMFVKELAEKAQLRKKISPHSFRHSFASHLVNNGADIRIVQELLGHASIITTEIYTHLDNQKLVDAIHKFHPRNAG
jgi:integrase/recombinase XerD